MPTDSSQAHSNSDEPTNIVNVHDPFFLWGIKEHSDETLIRAYDTLPDDDRSRLYWSCYYYKREKVCEYILKNCQLVRTAQEAIEKLSEMTKAGDSKEPDLTQIPVPFMLPTSPDFIVKELRDGSFIPSKGKPLKFTAVSEEGQTKT
jgi:hypothetical protein